MKTVIAIDGLDGSGKSTFARHLIASLAEAGETAVLLRVDDFRQPVTWTTPECEADLYYDSYYDLAQCESCLRSFVAGEDEVAIPMYDIVAEKVTGTRGVDLRGATVAIVEGVFPLRIPQAAAGLLIYLDASEGVIRDRILARDLQKSRTAEEIARRIDRRYVPSQRRYLREHRPRDRADIVIDNEDPSAPRTLRCDLSRVPEPLHTTLGRIVKRPEPR